MNTDSIRTIVTDHDEMLSDRYPTPRGTTPLLDLQVATDTTMPNHYREFHDRTAEYRELLRRGATPQMCRQFCLEFTPEAGIVAWADYELQAEFGGLAMRIGDDWKIQLGRRVTLEASDKDGSQFLEDLLDEIVHHPLWETVQERPGIWLTRPRWHRDDPRDPDDAFSSHDVWNTNGMRAIHLDDYDRMELDSSDDDTSADDRSEPEGEGGTADGDGGGPSLAIEGTACRDSPVDSGAIEAGLMDFSTKDTDSTDSDFDSNEDLCEDFLIDDTDSADSDFDSNEELSGDELVVEQAGTIFAMWPNANNSRNIYYYTY